MKNIGIYIHIPFCEKKCPYCDFYSRLGTDQLYDEYTDQMISRISTSPYAKEYIADTLYFGGGTPSLLGAERIGKIIEAVKRNFFLKVERAEITVEVNPSKNDFDFTMLKLTGVNRISFGLQSANDDELKMLGRLHNSTQASKCIVSAQKSGFNNISLDLMLAIPGQTKESLRKSVDFCVKHNAVHISAYILKIEPNTVFARQKKCLNLPDEDEAADYYEYLCELMRQNGYVHYEISNFCKEGYEGRHNLKYWHDEEYLGFGPSAHSFMEGKRFYTPRKLKSFYTCEKTDDGNGGDEAEYIMLALRLKEGIDFGMFRKRFGYPFPEKYLEQGRKLAGIGLVDLRSSGISLSEKGFLVSNTVIAKILEM